MSETIGKRIECDRCGKTLFLKYIGTKEFDGGFTKVSEFEPKPEAWVYHTDIGLLCYECEQVYQNLLNEFFFREE